MSAAIVRADSVATKGGARLFCRRVQPVGPAHPVPLILVHGSSLAAIPTFDLAVADLDETSLAAWFAARARDCWIFDHAGYGGSTIDAGEADIAAGVDDLVAITDHVRGETGAGRVDLYGIAAGALRAACFAAAHPARLRRLVLDAFVWTGEGSPKLAGRRGAVATMGARRPVDRAFVESIFAGEDPACVDPRIVAACIACQAAIGRSAPTGTYRDMTTRLPLVDPAGIAAPTLLLRGAAETLSTIEDATAFFRGLPSGNRQFTVLPGVIHCSPLGVHRRRVWRSMDAWLSEDD